MNLDIILNDDSSHHDALTPLTPPVIGSLAAKSFQSRTLWSLLGFMKADRKSRKGRILLSLQTKPPGPD